MKIRLTLLILLTGYLTSYGQTVTSYRMADLIPGGYSIFGDAFLEELDNGDLQFRLSPDFSTPNGPDVRIFLNNSVSTTGGVEIANLSSLGHFSGELIITLPNSIDINQYNYVVFYCYQFNLLWASGEFGTEMTSGFTCEASTVSLSNGANMVDICPTDGNSDVYTFTNSLSSPVGTNYAYLITDDNQILQEVITGDSYDFEGTQLMTQRVYGVHYDGTLNPVIGSDRMQTTATECVMHSNNVEYVTITKMACPPPFTCDLSSTFGQGGQLNYDICVDDGQADLIQLRNSLDLFPDLHYAYLLTDDNEVVQEVIIDVQSYDFEESSAEEQRIYGVHYDGDLQAQIGQNRLQTSATECYEHSSSSVYITITKNACIPPYTCEESNISLSNGQGSTSICPTDGMADSLTFNNSLNIGDLSHYAYLITDTDEIVQSVVVGNTYNFEGTTTETQHVYGINFDGDLEVQVGQIRTNTTATGCFIHSSTSNYVTILKEACPPVFTCLPSGVSANGSSTVDVCPTDNLGDSIRLSNTVNVIPGVHYAYLLTDTNDVLQQVILDSIYDFEGSGLLAQRIYGIHFDGDLQAQIGANRLQTTATGCYEHSSSNFLTITKEGCPPPFMCSASQISLSNGSTQINVCTADNNPDTLKLANSLILNAGDNYTYLLTDTNDILIEVIDTDFYTIDMNSTEPVRIYGVHFDGDLQAQIGANRLQTTATGCYEHSTGTFVSVTKEGCPPPPFMCLTSQISLSNGSSLANVCTTDSDPDTLWLANSLILNAGSNYAYLLTDTNDILLEVIDTDFYTITMNSTDPVRIYGVHYDGTLQPRIGELRDMTEATGCIEHSVGASISVLKDGCPTPNFECKDNITATDNWVTSLTICPNDGFSDSINLKNNLFIAPGEHYAYLITDTNNVLMTVVIDSVYNFEGSTIEPQRVYGIHYDGMLNAEIGANRLQTTATGCFTHSSSTIFLTIVKECGDPFECVESLTATHAWVTNVDICVNDNEEDIVFLQNNINTPPGDHYAFLLTDTNQILQEVVLDTIYDFTNTNTETQRVYGISYDGDLIPMIGEDRKNTEAVNCFIHSGDNLFITINKIAGCSTATEDVTEFEGLNVFPNPSNGQIRYSLEAENEIQYINVLNIFGQVVDTYNQSSKDIFIADSGIYYIQFMGDGLQSIKKVIVVK